jgi:hypothetical protein
LPSSKLNQFVVQTVLLEQTDRWNAFAYANKALRTPAYFNAPNLVGCIRLKELNAYLFFGYISP